MTKIVSTIEAEKINKIINIPESFGKRVQVIIIPQHTIDKNEALEALKELDGCCKGFTLSLEETRRRRLEEKYGNSD